MKSPLFVSLLAALALPLAQAQTPAAAPSAAPAAAAPAPAMAPAPAVPAPPPEPDPARMAAAKNLMENMKFAQTTAAILDEQKKQMTNRIDMAANMLPKGGASPEDIANYKKQMLDTYVNGIHIDDITADMIKVYAELFTVDQMNVMADFYKSDAGQALVAKTLDLQRKSGAIFTNRISAPLPAMGKIDQQFRQAHAPKPASAPAPAPVPTAPSAPTAPAAPSAPAPAPAH